MEYENLCRTCLRVAEKDAVELTNSVFEFLTQDLGINSVPKEHPVLRLPQIVCCNCSNRIIEFQEFLTKCREAELFFKANLEVLSEPSYIDERASVELSETVDVDHITFEEATNTLEREEQVFSESASLSVTFSSDSESEIKVRTVDDIPKQVRSGRSRRICNVCGKQFRDISRLRDHENMHKGIKPFCCDVCGKCFTQKNTLVTHQALHYGKQIECEECGKKFARKSALMEHDRTHSKEKPFVCEVEGCKADFRVHHSLVEHQAKHKGIRNFRCEICDHDFYTKRSLTRHKNKVHPKFSYQCDVCLSWFLIPSYVRKHMASKHNILIEDVLHLRKAKSADDADTRGKRKRL